MSDTVKSDSPSLYDLDQKNLLQNYGPRHLHLQRGEGSFVFDSEGNKYLDCVTGVAVNALGHAHPAILQAIQTQLQCYVHLSNLYLLEPQQKLAALLTEQTGFARVFFCNSGTEANEGAIKFVRKYWGAQTSKKSEDRFEIITLQSSFHGRTYAAMAATGQDKIKTGFGPLPGGFLSIPPNDISALDAAMTPTIAAILFEPILAEGGVLDLTPAFVERLKYWQNQGILLIADEIQTGLGRTGTFLATQGLGIKPDLVTLAKPLGGGLPLGAILLREEIANAIHTGDHGSTFGGNPVACAAGIAVVSELVRTGFLKDVQERSSDLRRKLDALRERVNHSQEIMGPLRGKGFLIGFSYTGDLAELMQKCMQEGLLIYRAGASVIRLLPPLNLSPTEIDTLIDRLGRVMLK